MSSMEIDFKKYHLRCELFGHFDCVHGICVCGDKGFASSSRDKTVRFWSLDSSDKPKYISSKFLVGHSSFVGPLAWISPDEEFPEGRIVSGGMDGVLIVWDLRTEEKLQSLEGHQLQVTGIALEDNGDIVSSSRDCTLRRWRDGQPVDSWQAHKSPVEAVIKLPSGDLVSGSVDTTLKLWRGTTHLSTFAGHTNAVRGLAVMPGLRVLSASHDGSIRSWGQNGQPLESMVGHAAIVHSVDSHFSEIIVSGSEDRFAKIWKDGVCMQSLEHPGCVWDAKFLGNTDIVTACSDGVIRIWTVDVSHMADAVELEGPSIFRRSLSKSKGLREETEESTKDVDELSEAPVEKNPAFEATKGKGKLIEVATEEPLDPAAENLHQPRFVEKDCDIFDLKFVLDPKTGKLHRKTLQEELYDEFGPELFGCPESFLPIIAKSISDGILNFKKNSHFLWLLAEVMRRSMAHLNYKQVKYVQAEANRMYLAKKTNDPEASTERTDGKENEPNVERPPTCNSNVDVYIEKFADLFSNQLLVYKKCSYYLELLKQVVVLCMPSLNQDDARTLLLSIEYGTIDLWWDMRRRECSAHFALVKELFEIIDFMNLSPNQTMQERRAGFDLNKKPKDDDNGDPMF